MRAVPRTLNRSAVLTAAILLAATAGLYVGWRVFWFLTDDAYIAFRYISNAHLGLGYVWNAPPFKPVEGYTSFLWVLLLDLLWRITGLEPPATANAVALVFAAGSLLLTAALVLRLRLGPALARWRLPLLVLVLLGTLSNRTFLAWTSSGLETAMFNFWLTAWVFVAVSLPPGRLRWLTLLSALAMLLELTRPDGLLFLAATLVLIAAGAWQRWRARALRPSFLLALSPFALTVAHLLWRLAVYGAWLPNTYAAKYVGPWPESGARYVLSFIIEYAWWFWLALAAAFLVLLAVRHTRALPSVARRWLAAPLEPAFIQLVVVGALVGHFLYYTVLIGGDHFEYRVYSHLVPLLWVSLVWLLDHLLVRPAWALGLATLSLAASLPIPWTHWAISQPYTTRLETWAMRLPVAPHFPAPVRPYVQVFDTLQDWLIVHAVGVRHQEHKLFIASQLASLPPRAAGLLLSTAAEAVRIEGAVGAIAWVLPTTAIIDAHGLNDLVIAHHPVDPAAPRLMAHDRIAPAGYLDCLQANAFTPINKFIIAQRGADLSALVPTCENTAWPLTRYRENVPGSNLALAPVPARVLDNIWMPDPLFIHYVPPTQTPVQPPAALLAAFHTEYHDTGCLVYPPSGQADGYDYAFLPANLRYTPDELEALFPWANLVSFALTGGPRPYTLGYALPAGTDPAPLPATPHAVAWPPAALLGFDLAEPTLTPGGYLEATLFFQATQSAPTEQWFRLSLVSTAQPDVLIATDQADPCRGIYPAWLWQPGETIVAKAVLAVPPDLPPGQYALRLDMFDLSIPDVMLPAAGDQTLVTLTLP
jgi:arabinofuranosyltransferase